MNLEQTIAELEKKAQQYTDAANTLRALEAGGAEESPVVAASTSIATEQSSSSKGSKSAGAGRKGAAKNSSSKKGQQKAGQKRYVSPETRAKITAALKASHAARKAAAAAA